MRKLIAVLIGASISLTLAGTAQAKPGQYTTFSAVTAFNGAHQYARSHWDGVPNRLKTFVDCHRTRPTTTGRSAKWFCDVDVYEWNTRVDSTVVAVLRRDGRFVFRSVERGESR